MAIRKPKDEFVLPTGPTTPASKIAQDEMAYYTKQAQAGKAKPVPGVPVTQIKPPVMTPPTMVHPSNAAPTPPPAPAPVAAPEPAPSPDIPDYSTQMMDVLGQGSSGADFSGALAALQGAYGAIQQPTSILDQLTSLLGSAPEAPKVDINGEAQRQIDLKYGGQEAALQNLLKQLGTNYRQGVNEQQSYGANADKSLADIFAALQNDMQGSQQRTAGNYNQAATQVGSSYDTAADQLRNINSEVTGQLQQSAGDLNLQQALPAQMARLLGNYQRQAGSNATNRGIAMSGLGTSQANQLALGEDQIRGAQRQGATARSDVASQVQAALAQLGLQNAQGQNQVAQQQTELARQKPLDLQGIISGLTQNQYQQERQAQQDRLAQITGLGGLDVQNQQLQLSGNKQQIDLQTALANMLGKQAESNQQTALERQKMQLQYNNPLDNMQKLAQIQNLGQTTALNGQKLQDLITPPVKSGTPRPELLDQFLSTPQDGLWGTGGAGPKFRAVFSDPNNSVIGQAQNAKVGNPNIDEFTYAMQLLNDPKNVPATLNLEGLKKALSLYYRGR